MSNYSTTFLLPKNDIITGMGSVGNIFGGYRKYNTSETGAEADRRALENDFGMVGKDIQSSLDTFGKDYGEMKKK